MSVKTIKRRAMRRIHAGFQRRLEQEVRRTFELVRFSMDVFGGLEPAQQWLRTPHPELDVVSPGDCAKSEIGLARVRGILAGLKYGGVV
jgi:putative toxin-antitoxin system antitoxin component (TIGR02293 family)